MKRLFTSIPAILLLFFISFQYFNNKQIVEKEEVVSKERIPRMFSQRKAFVKGKLKKDSPNLFAEYHKQIRTEFGHDFPKYSINHKIVELNKALKRVPLGKKNDLSWISRGPGNVGGRARGIIIDPDDKTANTWFIAAVGGGVWKTTDAGVNWKELTSDMGSLSASYMAMSPSNHDVIYLGTGEGFGNLDALGGQGMWKSIDRGNSWTQLASTAKSKFGIINRIIVDPNDENILLAATSISDYSQDNKSGIWKSIDGGKTWKQRYLSSNKVQQIICDPNDFKIQYASVYGYGIIKSIDSGETWHLPTDGLKSGGRVEFTVSHVNTKRLYASVDGNPSEIWYSTDKAETWKKGSSAVDFLGGQGWYDNAIIADPYNEKVIYVAGVNIYKIKLIYGGSLKVEILTDNYGENPDLHKGTHVDNHFFAVAKLDDAKKEFRLVGTNDGGMCFTDDEGKTFKQPNAGFITSQFYGIDKANGKDRYIGGMQDNSCYLSPENSTSKNPWKFIFGGDGFDVVWNYEDENKVMLTSQFNNIAITHSGIETLYQTGWVANVESGRGVSPFFTKLAQSKQYSDLVFAFGKSGIWRTEDFGITWRNIHIPNEFEGTSSSTEVKISLVDPSVVWAGSTLSSSAIMNVSVDFGKSFEVVSPSKDAKSRISGFATHPLDKNTAYALFSSYGNAKILKTTDLGKTWKDLSGFANSTDGNSTNGFPDVAVYDLLVMPYDTNIIWAGTEIGIFESKDNGVSWSLASNGLPPVAVYDFLIVNDEVVVGTHGRGVWSVSLPELKGYEPPVTSIPPSFSTKYSFDKGDQFAKVNLKYRSDYSYVKVYINDALSLEFKDVTRGSTEEFLLDIDPGSNIIKVVSESDGHTFEATSTVVGLPLKETVSTFVTDFESKKSLSDDFYGSGFKIELETGFDSKAIQTAHPYIKNSTKVFYLRNPITVNSKNAEFKYKDVAIVELGEKGTSYPDQKFWDYVAVEASKDGENWMQFETPYDASYDLKWESLYKTGVSPTKSNLVEHNFKTTDLFNEGDIILIRFRLFSDEETAGWGWIIDDLSIQEGNLSIDNNSLAKEFKIFPNPVVSETLYLESNSERKIERVELYNISGQLIFNNKLARATKTEINVSAYSSGQYVLKVETDKGSFSKKILIK